MPEDSLGIDALLNEVQSIEPANDMERGYMTVINVLGTHAQDLTAMSNEQTEELRQLANSCPLDFGFGVYMARAALVSMDGPKGYMNECEYGPVPQPKGKPNVGMELNSIAVYPNPAMEGFMVEYRLAAGQTGSIEIIDPLGRVQSINRLSDADTSVSVDADSMTPGVYLLRYLVDGVAVNTERISIVQ